MPTIESINEGWTAIAPGRAPSQLLYMDTFRAFAQQQKEQSYQLLNLQPGMAVLDVGCGAGDDIRNMAQIVGEGGKAVGVDLSETMIAEAQTRSAASLFPVEFRLADAHELPFAPESFDRCRAERVFQHLADPIQGLQEMIRVLKPTGTVVIIDPDWETLVVDGVSTTLLRKFVAFICDHMVKNANIGRQLPNLFKEAGLEQVAVQAAAIVLSDYELANKLWGLERNALRAVDAAAFTKAECDEWITTLQQAHASQRFFGSTTGFAVHGQKT